MVCKHCGAEIIYGSRFCNNCAVPIEYDEKTIKENNVKLVEKQKILKRKKILKKIKKSVVLLIVF